MGLKARREAGGAGQGDPKHQPELWGVFQDQHPWALGCVPGSASLGFGVHSRISIPVPARGRASWESQHHGSMPSSPADTHTPVPGDTHRNTAITPKSWRCGVFDTQHRPCPLPRA